MTTCPPDSAERAAGPARAGLGLALALALGLLAWPALVRLARTWQASSTWLPLGALAAAAGVAAWRARRPLAELRSARLPGGPLGAFGLALLLVVLGARSGLWQLAWVALPLLGLSALGLLRGEDACRRYGPAALLLLLAIPPPNAPTYALIAALKTLVASGAAGLLTLCGLSTQLDGWVLRFAGGELRLVDACSGARTQSGLLAVAAALLCLRSASRAEALATLAACAPAALAASVLRVTCVGVLYAAPWVGAAERGWIHDLSGVLVIAPGVLLLLAAGWLVRAFEAQARACAARGPSPLAAPPGQPRATRPRATSPRLALALTLAAGGALLVRARPLPCPGHPPPPLPGQPSPAAEQLRRDLAPDALRARQGLEGSSALWLHYCDLDMPHHAYAHATEVCYAVSGWTVLEERELPLGEGGALLRLRLGRRGQRRLVHLAFLDAEGRASPSLVGAWLGRAGARLARRSAAGSLLVLSSAERRRFDPAAERRELERARRVLARLAPQPSSEPALAQGSSSR